MDSSLLCYTEKYYSFYHIPMTSFCFLKNPFIHHASSSGWMPGWRVCSSGVWVKMVCKISLSLYTEVRLWLRLWVSQAVQWRLLTQTHVRDEHPAVNGSHERPRQKQECHTRVAEKMRSHLITSVHFRAHKFSSFSLHTKEVVDITALWEEDL